MNLDLIFVTVHFVLLIFVYGTSCSQSAKLARAVTLTELELKEICQGVEFQLIGHPDNQQNYILCVPGAGIERSCPANQCFDEHNPPCATVCKTDINAIDQTVKDYCNADKTAILDRVANDKDCTSYFICLGKTVDPLSQKCPANQHYAEEKKTCLSYYEANCAASSKWCKRKRNGTRFPHHKCYEYYECENQTTLHKSCSYNEYFDGNLGKCVSGICSQDHRKPDCQGKSDGLRIVHAKCYKYFVCLNQSLFEAQCSTNYYFDKNYRKCIRDFNSVCIDI